MSSLWYATIIMEVIAILVMLWAIHKAEPGE